MKTKTYTDVYYDCNECITIGQSGDGRYWITFGANGSPYGLDVIYNPTVCGGFNTRKEAIGTMLKLRPHAQLWDII